MRDFAGMHGHGCDCPSCRPYVPADKDVGRYMRRFEIGGTLLIVFLFVVWAVSR